MRNIKQMKVKKKAMLLCSAAFAVTLSIAPNAKEALTPLQVAQKYDDELRKAHTTLSVKFKLSTCRYTLQKAQLRCAEKPRVRVVENVVKYFGRDLRSIGIISEPVGDRGIGMLSWQYYDSKKTNDNWMYLPALGKVKRVVAVKDSRDSGSYFGSEFYIEDLEEPKLDEYTYKIIGEESIRVVEVGKGAVDSPAYRLEWTPTAKRNGATNYSRFVTWIDKKRFVLLKGDYYDHNGALFKRRTINNLQLVEGNWLPRQVTMDNLTARRVTVMDRTAIAVNIQVDDDYLTQRALTDDAYRERYLSIYRKKWGN